MPFWTDNLLINSKDPKRNFRFRVTFNNNSQFGDSSTAQGIWYAKKVTQPSVTIGEAKHDFMMHKFYWPGKVEWNELEMTLVDPVQPDVSTQFLSAIQNAGFVVPTNGNFTSVSKAAATLALGNVLIEQLDADGNYNHQWTLQHAWAREVKFSDLDYGNEDLMEISLKIRYDWAEFSSQFAGAAGSKIFSPS